MADASAAAVADDVPFEDPLHPDPEASVEPTALTPMKRAAVLVALEREKKDFKSKLSVVEKEIAKHKGVLLQLVEDEEFPSSSRVNGATVFTREEVWASPAPDADGNADHGKLAAVLEALGMNEYLPKSVNAQSMSAYVRERLDTVPALNTETGEILTFDERLKQALAPALYECLKVSNPTKVVVTGA